jgi:hypothetical protein
MKDFTDPRGVSFLIKPTKKGMETQHGGARPRNIVVAYFVYRLADTTNADTPVSREALAESPEEKLAFNYKTAREAERLGYATLVRKD